MTTISMSEFRRDADAVMLKVQQGETVVVTDEGKPTVKMAPVAATADRPGEPKGFADLAAKWDSSCVEGQGFLTNEEIDRIVYGH